MRAVMLVGTGGPEMLQVRDDVPDPVCGPGDVVVEVAACGVNNTDINTRIGWYGGPAGWGGGLRLPRIQGADVCGRVVEAGAGVDAALLGRRVLVDPWIRPVIGPQWREHVAYLGSECDGGFAERCVVPAVNAHPVESDLSDVELATFPCSWSTAEHMLTRADLRAGQRVVVTGASGGVGSALVQLAKLRGAHVTAITSMSKRAAVAALGADDLVVRDQPGAAPGQRLRGAGFDVVADVVGGHDAPHWWATLRRGGRYVVAGALAGPEVELDLRHLYLNDLELIGATAFGPDVFASLLRHIESGRLRPQVAATFSLEEIRQAQEAFVSHAAAGSVVVTPSPRDHPTRALRPYPQGYSAS